MDTQFWDMLDTLLAQSHVMIDRPKGSSHPKYPHCIYPLDYGFLENTVSMDGGGIDIWRGSLPEKNIHGIICTVDLIKRDSEIKLLLGCTEAEMAAVLAFHNDSEYMKGILIQRERGN